MFLGGIGQNQWSGAEHQLSPIRIPMCAPRPSSTTRTAAGVTRVGNRLETCPNHPGPRVDSNSPFIPIANWVVWPLRTIVFRHTR